MLSESSKKDGNTSTYVEKIINGRGEVINRMKHLHIRGENREKRRMDLRCLETPPHTWRKFVKRRQCLFWPGNTSTYVEKIYDLWKTTEPPRKHLHIRGENVFLNHVFGKKLETPPHTWRK